MTLLIVLFIVPPALWAADRVFNRGEFFTLLREELNIAPAPKVSRGARRLRITVRR
ncbi:MAG: hypothetical protein J0H63_03350 [Rhizobiales bacterium]|jgi:hypothetical protein|nr:hypothetical protein [Hyphomicrobiales bacterium]MBN9009193.1 hypothetical protein [Hyphomicrobiales bacterium]